MTSGQQKPLRNIQTANFKSYKPKLKGGETVTLRDSIQFNTNEEGKIRPADSQSKSRIKVDGFYLEDLLSDTDYTNYIKKANNFSITYSDTTREKTTLGDRTDISFEFKFDRAGEFKFMSGTSSTPGTAVNWTAGIQKDISNADGDKQKTKFIFPPKKDWDTKNVFMHHKDISGFDKLDSNGQHYNVGKTNVISNTLSIDTSSNTKYLYDNNESRVLETQNYTVTNNGNTDFRFKGTTLPEIDVSGKKAIIFKIHKTTDDPHPFFITNTDYSRGAGEADTSDIPPDNIKGIRYYTKNPTDVSGWDMNRFGTGTYSNSNYDGLLFKNYDSSYSDAFDISNAGLGKLPVWTNSGQDTLAGHINPSDISSGKLFFNQIWNKSTNTVTPWETEPNLGVHHMIELSGNASTPGDISSVWLSNQYMGGAKNELDRYSGEYFKDGEQGNSNKIKGIKVVTDLSNASVPLELRNSNNKLVELTTWGGGIDMNFDISFYDSIGETDVTTSLNKNSWGKLRKTSDSIDYWFKNTNRPGWSNKEIVQKTGYPINDASFDKHQKMSWTNGSKDGDGRIKGNDDAYRYVVLYVTPDMSENYSYHCKNHPGMTGNFKIKNIPQYVHEFTKFNAKGTNGGHENDEILFGNENSHLKINNPPRRFNIEIETSLKSASDALGRTYDGELDTVDPDGYRKIITQGDKIRLSYVNKDLDDGGDWDTSFTKLKNQGYVYSTLASDTNINDLTKGRHASRTRKGHIFSNLLGDYAQLGTRTAPSTITKEAGFIKDDTRLNEADNKFKTLFMDLSGNGGAPAFTNIDNDKTRGIYEVLDISFENMFNTTGNMQFISGGTTSSSTTDGRKTEYKYSDAKKQFKYKFKHVLADSLPTLPDLTSWGQLETKMNEASWDSSFNKAFVQTIKAFKEPVIHFDISGAGATKRSKLSAIINLDDTQNRDMMASLDFNLIGRNKNFGTIDGTTNGEDISASLTFNKIDANVKALFLDLVTDADELGLPSTLDGSTPDNIKTRVTDGDAPLMYMRIDKYNEDGTDASGEPIEFTLKVPNVGQDKIPTVFALPSNKDPTVANNYYDIVGNTEHMAEANVPINHRDNEVVYMGRDEYGRALVYVKYTGNTTLGVSVQTMRTSSTGDPYIEPLIGPRYKLPDGEFNYRLVDNNIEENRFFINCDTWMLGKNEVDHMQDFVYNVVRTQYNLKDRNDAIEWVNRTPGIKMVSDACFMRHIHIYNDGDTFTFDLENFRPVGKYSSKFKINICKNEIPKTSIDSYKMRISDGCIKVITNTASFGKVTLTLLKFSNPQIRNGFKLETTYNLSKFNARGALLFSQKTKDITISSLESKEQISYPTENYDTKYIQEHFLQYYPNSDIRPKNSVEKIKTY